MALYDPDDVVTWSELYNLFGRYLACGCWIILILIMVIMSLTGWLWILV